MSEFFDIIKSESFRFVIPVPGKCFKSKIARNDKVLLLVLNKGYIETDSLFTCYYLTKFFESYKGNNFVPVSNIDKIRRHDGTIVYRQRLYFKSLTLLLKLIKKFEGNVIIPDSFRVDTTALVNVTDCIPYLEVYARGFNISIDTWLTNVLLINLYELCKEFNMLENINITYEASKYPDGYLARAPLLCGSYSVKNHTSSTVRLNNLDIIRLCNSDVDKTYAVVENNMKKLDNGFTNKKIKEDIRKGIFKL